jgi:hypothetical protein
MASASKHSLLPLSNFQNSKRRFPPLEIQIIFLVCWMMRCPPTCLLFNAEGDAPASAINNLILVPLIEIQLF